ncbi:ead/Ea22-like family protein [Citrobacter cronae]|uniref:ead/Ea22-like family protein n=1 Tax=Citrobacter cronae TaxID=1748967 RepID=UPI0018670932
MNNIDKGALREAADSVIQKYGSEWFETGRQLCTVHKSKIELISAANPATVLALLDELEVAEKRIAELEAREVTLPPLNDDLIAILGRPNFKCSHLAELMRKSGDEIRRKSEHEQAAVIHWFLGIYLEHGDKWEGVAKADIQSRFAAAGIGVKGE